MGFVRVLRDLMRDKEFGKRVVPIIPDEARTFGMDSFFPTAKIYNPKGQRYVSVDRDLMLSYKEATDGQILHVGINEAGSVGAFTAAGSSYSTHGEPMVPIYIFYSMFGFQRTGDGFWAAADQMARGFLLGATPRRQQVGEIVGVLTSAAFVALTVLLLAQAYGFGGEELPAPQATLMKLVIDGVLAQSLPWTLVAIGAAIAAVAAALRIPPLPFAVGVYLPVSTMLPVFFGGLLRMFMERRAPSKEEKTARRDRGILFGSGLVGGEGLIGVVIAGAAGYAVSRGAEPWSVGTEWAGPAAEWLSFALFVALIGYFAWLVTRRG